MYEKEALMFVTAIKTIAEKENNLNNLESYLTMHFKEWLSKWANSPENIAAELKGFADMKI